MVTIGICDDEQKSREILLNFCRRLFVDEENYEVKEFTSGEEVLRSEKTDILLLDIEMCGMDGIDVKDELQNQGEEVDILFITNYSERMQEAYGKNVFGFLNKPLQYIEFHKEMQKIIQDLNSRYKSVLIQGIDRYRTIYMRDIVYIKVYGKYVKVHTVLEDNAFFDDRNIKNWERRLRNSGFVMTHRSYLVNLFWVEDVGKESVLLKNGEVINISRRKKSIFMQEYFKYVLKYAK